MVSLEDLVSTFVESKNDLLWEAFEFEGEFEPVIGLESLIVESKSGVDLSVLLCVRVSLRLLGEYKSVLIGASLQVMKFEAASYDWALSYDLNENSDCLIDY